MARARILFLCTHNKARSQLAEGICRKLGGDQVEVYSTGSEPSAVHPCATEVLAGMGIDASGHRSKHIDDLRDLQFDYVVTVCDQARDICPELAGAPVQVHWSIVDPSRVTGSEVEMKQAFEQVARQLSTRIEDLLAQIDRSSPR